MCGICGFVDFKSKSDIEVLNKMVSTLHHRGPDDQGSDIYNYDTASVGLGHTRLSILDLSLAGHQPMNFEHLSIVFNGEIYNYREIKKELTNLGHYFKSDSDTEVILHSFSEWGNSCVAKFIGMFAFAILNKQTSEIFLFRDRAGVKPLYYYWKDELFLFASELKSFHSHPRFVKEIDENSVYQFMDYGFVPTPYCIFRYCNKLEPGHFLVLNSQKKTIEINKYWDISDYYRLPRLQITYLEAQKSVEALLISAFEYRMISDVPVGVFLSGGYDSAAVTALLQTRRAEKLKTFTIGFEEGNNEAPHAKQIAKYLGTDHTEYYCTTKEAQEIISDLPYYYDEPFADSSAIPTLLVSKKARESVSVALSADAGDEIFAGYTYYKTFLNNLNLINKIPKRSRTFLNSILKNVKFLNPLLDSHFKNKIYVLSNMLITKNELLPQSLHQSYFFLNREIINELFYNKYQIRTTVFNKDYSCFFDPLSIALATDYSFYLPNDILTKVDRATMSVSLEGREPLLDHRIIEYVAQLPIEYKYGNRQKLILKDIVNKYIPEELLDRPKVGFIVPIYKWLKKDLAYMLNENLSSNDICKTGLFQPIFIKKLVQQFKQDKLYNPEIIWKLLQFQMWYKKWMNL